MQRHQVTDFSAIEAEFIERVFRVVWCSVATIDLQGRPRSRVLHPYWEGHMGWIGTTPNSVKGKHLAANPHMSLAYVAEPFKPVYVEATAEWITDLAVKQQVWDWFLHAPPPMGYDPVMAFPAVDDPAFGVLKLTPWRIEVYTLGVETTIWQPAPTPVTG
jgi:general stress protein 26